MEQVVRVISTFCLIMLIFGCGPTRISTMIVDKDIQLSREEGYLLLSLDSDFQLKKFVIEGPEPIAIENMWEHEGRLYFLSKVLVGKYQIREVASYSGLYEFAEEDGLWEFQVDSNVISYVGELAIKRVSYGRSFFELVNNSSLALEFLEHKYPNILTKRRIRYLGPGEDSFFQMVRNSTTMQKEEGK